jgi:hypothetical protein
MARTNKQRILYHLTSIAPDGATNSDIREATGIQSHQQVYMLTQELMRAGRIRGVQRGREWTFWTQGSSPDQRGSVRRAPLQETLQPEQRKLNSQAFEELASRVLSAHFGTPLTARELPGVHKRFDLVSPDGRIVGDAKYYTLVRGKKPPPAKFSAIAEHVWLLENTGAPTTFLVFGNDPRVPLQWLERYGNLVQAVKFYFLTDEGDLELLN